MHRSVPRGRWLEMVKQMCVVAKLEIPGMQNLALSIQQTGLNVFMEACLGRCRILRLCIGSVCAFNPPLLLPLTPLVLYPPSSARSMLPTAPFLLPLRRSSSVFWFKIAIGRSKLEMNSYYICRKTYYICRKIFLVPSFPPLALLKIRKSMYEYYRQAYEKLRCRESKFANSISFTFIMYLTSLIDP